MVYLGDNWPSKYRDTLFTCNLHGNRVNNDSLVREGSGYVARHQPDFLKANDPWFRGMELKSGPDGGVFLTDWSDTGECHDTDADGPHRENGRIYKITYGSPRPVSVDLAKLGSIELAKLQTHPNEWHVRNARRLLQERAARGEEMAEVHRTLKTMFTEEKAVPRQLRVLWALYVTGGLSQGDLRSLATDRPEEWLRAWGVRLLVDFGKPSPEVLAALERLAKDEKSALVRLEVASALGKIPVADRKPIVEGLVYCDGDEKDTNLSLMIWYGMEPVVALDRTWAVGLLDGCQYPKIRQFIARRIIAADDQAGNRTGITGLIDKLPDLADDEKRRDVLDGLQEAFRGRKNVPIPKGWPRALERLSASSSTEVRNGALALALQFGDPRAVAILEETVSGFSQPTPRRIDAIRLLAERRVPGLAARLIALLDQPALRGAAIRALAGYDDPATPPALIRSYPSLTEAEKVDAVATLGSRPAYALALLDAVKAGAIPRKDLSVTMARQIQGMADPKVKVTLEAVWGTIRPTSADKLALMAKYKATLNPERMKAAELSQGRSIFQKNCMACHKLFDEGGNVGPELTGSDRANRDYVLENVLDPNASVAAEYKVATVATTDGRVLSGIIQQQDDKTLVIRTTNERIVLPREDVEEIKPSNQSMMPEGLFERLSDDEIRDLIAYLASAVQVPAKP
jgi:putative heme-binding domain-containing protein